MPGIRDSTLLMAARTLENVEINERTDIRLFLKLPGGFEIDTPVGKYNPDWAIVKHEDETLYLVRETRGTKDFLKLRTTEADKVRCGAQQFKALDVPFAVVVDDTVPSAHVLVSPLNSRLNSCSY
jgi:restriction endonuclease